MQMARRTVNPEVNNWDKTGKWNEWRSDQTRWPPQDFKDPTDRDGSRLKRNDDGYEEEGGHQSHSISDKSPSSVDYLETAHSHSCLENRPTRNQTGMVVLLWWCPICQLAGKDANEMIILRSLFNIFFLRALLLEEWLVSFRWSSM